MAIHGLIDLFRKRARESVFSPVVGRDFSVQLPAEDDDQELAPEAVEVEDVGDLLGTALAIDYVNAKGEFSSR